MAWLRSKHFCDLSRHTDNSSAVAWQRSMLVYDSSSRTSDAWGRHLMRVGSNGAYTGQWLFDAAILTTQTVNGNDIMYAQLSGTDMSDLLDMLFNDAAQLDSSAATLATSYGAPTNKIQVAIAVPWLNPAVMNLQLPGISGTLNLSNPSDRVTAVAWYLNQIQSRAQAANWKQLTLYGAYYQREDASDAWGDPQFIQQFNTQAHNIGLHTVWVPYYVAPNAWNGTSLGFDVVNVQPSYSFRSSIYEGEVNGGRLYSAGYKAAGQSQATEYEISSEGQSQIENWIAHQYLAISQFTGASAYPQVFFAGLSDDIFDQMTSQANAPGDMWWAYSDLTNYLQGQMISNMEIGLPWQPTQNADGTQMQVWKPSQPLQLNSIRLDFNDAQFSNPWRGNLVVQVQGPGGLRTAYAERSGSDDINPYYNSVLVPLPVPTNGDTTVTSLTITMSREGTSSWPNIQRLIAAQYEPTYLANGNYQEISTASFTNPTGAYPDSANTNLGYYAGKLTDGAISSNGDWYWNGVMGWNMEDGRFSVTIDLGSSQSLSSVSLYTHQDQTSGIDWPLQVAASVSNCPPHMRGVIGQSCAPTSSSGQATLSSQLVSGSTVKYYGTDTVPLYGQGRYVTVTGVCSGWCMFDEIEVFDTNEINVALGQSYTVSPAPTPNSSVTYADDSHKLVDGDIAPQYAPQFASMLTGIQSNVGGTVESTWSIPHAANTATIWMTSANSSYGVLLPSSVTIQWRDQNLVWQTGVAVTPSASCGPSACAQLQLPSGAQVTGVQAVFPVDTTWQGWFMVSEVSTQ